MPRKRYTAEQIITKLRQAEVEIARDQPIAEVCRKLGTSEQTYYRGRKEYGGLRVNTSSGGRRWSSSMAGCARSWPVRRWRW